MTDDELLKQDQALRDEADRLVATHRIIETLSEYGRTELYGSYSLRTMCWRDLDVYVLDERTDAPLFHSLCTRVAGSLNAMEMFFSNGRDYRPTVNGRGIYAGLLTGRIEEGAWKIDIWAYHQGNWDWTHQHHEAIKSRLDQDTRVKILRVKSMCWAKPEYRRRCWDYWNVDNTYGGFEIYQAVLNNGVNTYEEWTKHRAGEGK